MVYPEVRKFLAYAGLAMVLAPAFAPIVLKIAKGIYACINESREEIIFNSPLQEEDIYLNGGRSIMDIISAEEDDSIKMRAITISFPKVANHAKYSLCFLTLFVAFYTLGIFTFG